MTVEETICSRKEDELELELEETLSLCDLPLYSDQSADWDQDFSLNSNSTSSSSQQTDYLEFEFFSQELNPSAAFFPPENIVFCGKLIPYKQLSPCKTTDSSNQVQIRKTSRWQWKLSSKRQSVSAQSKNGNKSTTAAFMHQRHNKRYNTKQQLGKTKWYLFLFGISRFSPVVVELRDIRSRQRRSPAPGRPSGDDDKVSCDRGWGLWGMIIRALSCGGNQLPTAGAMPTPAM